jgi:hypothetical protein
MAAMLSQGVLALSLIIRAYDAYGVPAPQLSRARVTVDQILKDAGITVTWPQCPCSSPIVASELVVRIVAALPTSEPAALGFSYVDVARKAGTLATVFADRVHVLATAASVDEGELLGRAIAHEVTHLLLGTHDHQLQGLMRGQWATGDLALHRPWDWTLLPGERIKIRQAIARRSRESAPPAAVTADISPPSDVRAP